MLRDEEGTVILVASKDHAWASASFSRTLRSALKRMTIDAPLRGHQLHLVSAAEVQMVSGGQRRLENPTTPPDALEEDLHADRLI